MFAFEVARLKPKEHKLFYVYPSQNSREPTQQNRPLSNTHKHSKASIPCSRLHSFPLLLYLSFPKYCSLWVLLLENNIFFYLLQAALFLHTSFPTASLLSFYNQQLLCWLGKDLKEQDNSNIGAGHPATDVFRRKQKVQCCNDISTIGKLNVRTMSQGRHDAIREKLSRLDIDMLESANWCGHSWSCHTRRASDLLVQTRKL